MATRWGAWTARLMGRGSLGPSPSASKRALRVCEPAWLRLVVDVDRTTVHEWHGAVTSCVRARVRSRALAAEHRPFGSSDRTWIPPPGPPRKGRLGGAPARTAERQAC